MHGQEHEFPGNTPLSPKLELENITVLRAHTISSWNEISTPGSSDYSKLLLRKVHLLACLPRSLIVES